MLGDTAIAVNPKDERYKKLIDAKIILPLMNREIPVVADRLIDLEFGTGAVKITPAHDSIDYRIGKTHKLETINIIGEDGKITEQGGKYAGLKILDARNKIIEDLKTLNLLEKEEDYEHSLAICDRCETPIEPLISRQWFLKMNELAKPAIKAVKSEKIKITPERYKKTYLDWLSNIEDWCISRQLWWGHKIPIDGENDVLDTWFSSALWPFATLGWPEETKDLKEFYPTSLLVTAQDII
jgi:valyl-tRNA synthetase